MAFNKKARLQDNIEAIRIAFDLDKEGRLANRDERETLEAYCGFGGIKAVLSPADKPEDVQQWTKTDSELFPLVSELHGILRRGSENTAEYNRYVSSLKNSVLSAFYTPPKTDNEKLMKDVPTLKEVVESPWKKEDELKALKAEMTVMERKIEASLKPIEQSVGIMAGVPKEENKFVPMPDNLKNINALLGERAVIVRPTNGIPEKKGFKI